MDAALKQNVPFESVSLSWTSVSRENAIGITNLMMEGGTLNNGHLIDGEMKEPVTMFFSPVIKKRDKDPNKGKIAVPVYLRSQRSGAINSYG